MTVDLFYSVKKDCLVLDDRDWQQINKVNMTSIVLCQYNKYSQLLMFTMTIIMECFLSSTKVG